MTSPSNKSESVRANLPTPRLQFRWEKSNQPSQFGGAEWLCHYELVLGLGEHDIRREDADGNEVRSELALKMGCTVVGRSSVPCENARSGEQHFDAPFRDGAHAQWDSEQLGNLPIYCIAPDGTALEAPPLPRRPAMTKVHPDNPDKWVWRAMRWIERAGRPVNFRNVSGVGLRPVQRGIDQGWILGTVGAASLSPKAKAYMREIDDARTALSLAKGEDQ